MKLIVGPFGEVANIHRVASFAIRQEGMAAEIPFSGKTKTMK